MSKRTTKRLLMAFAIATIIFLFGIFIGEVISNSKINEIINFAEDIRLEILDLELQQSLSEYEPCGKTYLYGLGAKLDSLGDKLDYLEKERGKKDATVIELKKLYTLLQVRHYLLIKDRIEKCGEDYLVILFFYSNERKYLKESEKQGYVLQYFSDKYGYEKVKIYAIDGDLGLGITDMLKEKYKISIYPTTIVNSQIFEGFTEQEKFQKYF